MSGAALEATAATNVSDVAQTLLMRGDEFLKAGRYNEAIAEYTKAIELKPDFAEAYNNRGYAAFSKYDGTDPLPDLDRALALRPNFPHAYNSRGCVHMSRGETDLAISDFDRAIALQPDYPRALRNRANVLLKKGRFRQALADLEKAGSHPWRNGIIACTILLILAGLSAVLLGIILRLRLTSRRVATLTPP